MCVYSVLVRFAREIETIGIDSYEELACVVMEAEKSHAAYKLETQGSW